MTVHRPQLQLPGVAGASAKRLAANIGEGARIPGGIGQVKLQPIMFDCCLFNSCAAVMDKTIHQQPLCRQDKLLALICSDYHPMCCSVAWILQERTCKTLGLRYQNQNTSNLRVTSQMLTIFWSLKVTAKPKMETWPTMPWALLMMSLLNS